MKEKILIDDNLQDILEKEGFLVIDMLNKNEIDALDSFFNQTNTEISQKGMVIGSLIDKKEYKLNVENGINNIVENKINSYFKNIEVFNSSFVYKTPKTYFDFPPHQDNSMVDEYKSISVNIWIPLVDIKLHNGPLFIIPRSHFDSIKTYRGPNLKYIYLNEFNSVYKYAKPIYLKRGQAIILNHSVIHYSTPNFTNKIRKALVIAIKSKDAPSCLYYFNETKKQIQVYEVDDTLKYSYEKFHYDRNEKPVGKIITEINYDNKVWGKTELDKTFENLVQNSHYNPIKSLYLYKLKNIIRRKYIQLLSLILR